MRQCIAVVAFMLLPGCATHPYAQRLVERTLVTHHSLAHVVIHATPPGRPDTENRIIASSMGRLGKLADADDLRIMRTGVSDAVLARSGDRYNVALPMWDQHHSVVGVLALGFVYRAGDDTVAMIQEATRIRDGLAHDITSAATLFAGL